DSAPSAMTGCVQFLAQTCTALDRVIGLRAQLTNFNPLKRIALSIWHVSCCAPGDVGAGGANESRPRPTAFVRPGQALAVIGSPRREPNRGVTSSLERVRTKRAQRPPFVRGGHPCALFL